MHTKTPAYCSLMGHFRAWPILTQENQHISIDAKMLADMGTKNANREGGRCVWPIKALIREKELSGMVAQGVEAGVVAMGKERLANCPYHVLKSVLCEFQHGVLTLSGQLPTFFHKQLAQEAVGGLAGVRQVVNRIEVAARSAAKPQ